MDANGQGVSGTVVYKGESYQVFVGLSEYCKLPDSDLKQIILRFMRTQ